MVKKIIETKNFTKDIDSLIKKGQLLLSDFNTFTKELSENSAIGDIVPGTGGIRKARLKSASKGKSGGFRVCYYYLAENEWIYLLCIYAKNEQKDLTAQDKKELKHFVNILKRTKNG